MTNRFKIWGIFMLIAAIYSAACSSAPANPENSSLSHSIGDIAENNTDQLIDNYLAEAKAQTGTSDNATYDSVLDTGYYDKAIEASRAEFNASPSPSSREKLADAYISRAWFYKSRRLNSNAFDDLWTSVKLAPAYYRTQYEIGCFHNNQWQFDIGMYYLDKAIALKPDYAPAYAEKVYSYYRNQDYTEALINADKAIELDPSLAQAYYYRGLIYAASGKADLALEDLQKAVSLSKDDNLTEKVKADLQKLNEGTLYWKPGSG